MSPENHRHFGRRQYDERRHRYGYRAGRRLRLSPYPPYPNDRRGAGYGRRSHTERRK